VKLEDAMDDACRSNSSSYLVQNWARKLFQSVSLVITDDKYYLAEKVTLSTLIKKVGM